MKHLTHYIGPAIGLTLFCASVWVLSHEFRQLDLARVLQEFRNIGWPQVSLAMFLTVISYLVLTLYDVTALVYIGERLSYPRIALASFVGYTVSHNLGASLVSGGAARYRLFSSWGLSAGQIARAVAFSGVTYWLGFFLLCGLTLIVDPPPLPSSVNLPQSSLSVLGICFLALVAIYVFACAVRRKPFRIMQWEYPLPSPSLTITAMIVASIDWIFATSVNYALLPPGSITFIHFASVFLIGQVIGIISHVPGGLGVYESMLVVMLADQIEPNQVLGRLIAYRIIYYLVPVCISMVLLFLHELRVQREVRARS